MPGAGPTARERRTAAGGERSEADELRALPRDCARFQVENDIVKKAAAILGTIVPASYVAGGL